MRIVATCRHKEMDDPEYACANVGPGTYRAERDLWAIRVLSGNRAGGTAGMYNAGDTFTLRANAYCQSWWLESLGGPDNGQELLLATKVED